MKGPLSIARAMRPANCIMAGAAVWIGTSISIGDPAPITLTTVSGILSASSLLAFANVLNDIGDRRLDLEKNDRDMSKINVPSRSLWIMVFVLLTISIGSSEICILSSRMAGPGMIYCSALISVVLYESYLKERGISGNIIVGLLSGSLFLFGGSLNRIDTLTICISLAAVLASIAREVIKDIEDMEADSKFRDTLPNRIGPANAALGAIFLSFLSLPFSLYPMISDDGSIVYLALVILSNAFLLGFSFRTLSNANNARSSQNGIKVAMIVSFAAYVSLFTI